MVQKACFLYCQNIFGNMLQYFYLLFIDAYLWLSFTSLQNTLYFK